MPSNGSIAASGCIALNDFRWDTARDPTTLRWVWALFAFFYALIIVCGFIGNLCVILSISRTRSLQTVPNMFIFSLSCSDLMVCLTSATITPITAFKKTWIFGHVLCSVAPFLAIILILAVGLSVPAGLMHTLRRLDPYCGDFCFEDWGPYLSQRQAYGLTVLTVQFIIPLFVIIFCYSAISLRLGQSLILKDKKRWRTSITDQQRAATKRRQRTNRMFVLMVIAFSLSWVWSVVFNVLNDSKSLPKFIFEQSYLFGISTHCIAMTSTVWNPILYSLLNIQLRVAFVRLMPECIQKRVGTSDAIVLNRNGGRDQRSTLLLTADSRLFDHSGSSTPVPTTRNGYLTPVFGAPRNSLALSTESLHNPQRRLIRHSRNRTKAFFCCWSPTLSEDLIDNDSPDQTDRSNDHRHSLPLLTAVQPQQRRLSENPHPSIVRTATASIKSRAPSTKEFKPPLNVPSIRIDGADND